MRYDFVILGADGTQGTIVARYLLERNYNIFCADIANTKIGKILHGYKKQSTFRLLDIRNSDQLIGVIQKTDPDVVINCVEGDWNLDVFQACLHAKKNCIDLGSWFHTTGDQLKLNRDFRKIKKTAITGCGSVPGIGNVMLNFASKKFDSIESIDVGFAWDSNIKKFVVPFSIESVIEEHTIKAPYIQGGRLRRMYPKDSERMKTFRTVGTHKIFLSEHAEPYTFFYYFKSWGLKNVRFYSSFPEHSERVFQTLIELTFADKDPVVFEDKKIFPDRFLSQMLKRTKLPRGYKEWENLWVEITGRRNRRKQKILMECIIPPLKGWEEAGCNIDTGFPAAIIAEMIKYGDISKPGSFAPEAIVPPKQFFKALKKHKFSFFENGKKMRV